LHYTYLAEKPFCVTRLSVHESNNIARFHFFSEDAYLINRMFDTSTGKAGLLEVALVWSLTGILFGVFLLVKLGWNGNPLDQDLLQRAQQVQRHQHSILPDRDAAKEFQEVVVPQLDREP
jgi:hypothetical protein